MKNTLHIKILAYLNGILQGVFNLRINIIPTASLILFRLHRVQEALRNGALRGWQAWQ